VTMRRPSILLGRLAAVAIAMSTWAAAPLSTQAAGNVSVQITASRTLATPGQTVTITATATGSGWTDLQVVGSDGSHALCTSSPCTLSESSGSPYAVHYWAAASSSTGQVLATSSYVFVVWGQPSDACFDGNFPSQVLFDGHIGGDYLRLDVVTRVDNSSVVCYRIDSGGTEQAGGSVVAAGTGGMDSLGSLCTTTAGNIAPGPHPLVSGAVSSVPFAGDLFMDSGGDVWVCVQLGGISERLLFTAQSGSAPIVSQADSGPNPEPQDSRPSPGYPSATCQASGGSALLNALIAGTGPFYIATATPNSSTTDVCVVLPTVGGLLTVSSANPVSISSNFAPCTVPLFQLSTPAQALLASSPPGAVPATVCAAAAGQQFAISVPGSPPTVAVPIQYTPDPTLPV